MGTWISSLLDNRFVVNHMRELKYRAEEAVQYEVRTKLLKHIITVPRTSVRTAMFCDTVCSAVCSAVSSTSNRIYIPVILKPKKLLKILTLFCARSIRGNINCIGLHSTSTKRVV